ncbi:DUF4296 domain-containing protein [Chitinophaga lutea]
MNFRTTAAILLLSLAAACGQAGKVPKDVIGQDKMRDILLDMNYAEVFGRDAGIDTVYVADSVREQRIKTYYVQILQLHDVSLDAFRHSYKYYESHPDKLDAIYKQMQEIVTKRREAMDSVERSKNESIAGISRRTRLDSLYCPQRDMTLILPVR